MPTNNHVRFEHLKAMSETEFAFWLIQSFSPERYRAGDSDVIERACYLFYQKIKPSDFAHEFIVNLWAMFGEAPDSLPNYSQDGTIVAFRPNYDKLGTRDFVKAQTDEIEPPFQYRRNRGYSYA